MLYTSVNNEKIKEIKKLKEKKYRDKYNLFLIEGRHLVLEAYKKNAIKELILEQNEIFPLDVPTLYVTNDIINNLTSLEDSCNVLAVCHKLVSNENVNERILILDGVQDPGNLGTIIRSAVAFHIDTIILSDDTVDIYNDKVIRASQGMIFHINILRKNLLQYIPLLKQQGYPIIGTKVTYGNSLKTLEKLSKFAIIVGNEGNGVREDTLALCDKFIYIDMASVCESLNVGVATSIILYELDRL